MSIYFDNAATTKPYEEVIEAVANSMREYFGNPSSLHRIGIKSERRLGEARESFAKAIKATKDEIYFTSGGSEGNNLILKGLLKPGHHLITTTFEHGSIINTCKNLEVNGIKITYLNVDEFGRINLNELEEAITKDTSLISIMHVNNEMGVIQDLEAIGKLIKEKSSRAKLHVDAVQGYGKFPIDIKAMNIDFLTVAGHKIHGPKGVGFVYIKKGIVLNPLLSGGEQEKGVRSGTQDLPNVIGLEKASEITLNNIEITYNKVYELKKYMIERLSEIDNIRINSPLSEEFSPYILSVSFIGARAEVLLHLLEEQDVYVSSGSACSSKSSMAKGSYVIRALGLNEKEIESTIRFSFSGENTKEEIDKTIDVLVNSLKFLRRVKR